MMLFDCPVTSAWLSLSCECDLTAACALVDALRESGKDALADKIQRRLMLLQHELDQLADARERPHLRKGETHEQAVTQIQRAAGRSVESFIKYVAKTIRPVVPPARRALAHVEVALRRIYGGGEPGNGV